MNQQITNNIKSAIQEALEIEDRYEKEKLKKWKKVENFTPSKKRKQVLHN